VLELNGSEVMGVMGVMVVAGPYVVGSYVGPYVVVGPFVVVEDVGVPDVNGGE
jgi:hypothetical protein